MVLHTFCLLLQILVYFVGQGSVASFADIYCTIKAVNKFSCGAWYFYCCKTLQNTCIRMTDRKSIRNTKLSICTLFWTLLHYLLILSLSLSVEFCFKLPFCLWFLAQYSLIACLLAPDLKHSVLFFAYLSAFAFWA